MQQNKKEMLIIPFSKVFLIKISYIESKIVLVSKFEEQRNFRQQMPIRKTKLFYFSIAEKVVKGKRIVFKIFN